MIAREVRERRQTELVIDRVQCDRCGKDVRLMNGIGVPAGMPWEGSNIAGSLYPTANSADAEHWDWQLCTDCTLELSEWIGAERIPVDERWKQDEERRQQERVT